MITHPDVTTYGGRRIFRRIYCSRVLLARTIEGVDELLDCEAQDGETKVPRCALCFAIDQMDKQAFTLRNEADRLRVDNNYLRHLFSIPIKERFKYDFPDGIADDQEAEPPVQETPTRKVAKPRTPKLSAKLDIPRRKKR